MSDKIAETVCGTQEAIVDEIVKKITETLGDWKKKYLTEIAIQTTPEEKAFNKTTIIKVTRPCCKGLLNRQETCVSRVDSKQTEKLSEITYAYRYELPEWTKWILRFIFFTVLLVFFFIGLKLCK